MESISADTMSRLSHASDVASVYSLRDRLAHPGGITRLWHFVKSQNLPYSLDDVQSTIAQCAICRKLKPSYAMKATGTLIKSNQPFERLSIDLVGPKTPSLKSGNTYVFTVIVEYSRLPFAFPLHDISSQSLIECINHLIYSFGVPKSLHSDRGSQFTSK